MMIFMVRLIFWIIIGIIIAIIIGFFLWWIFLQTDLTIAKSHSPEPVPAGDDLTYRIRVINAGFQDATGVSIKDTLAPGLSLVSADPRCVLIAGTNVVKCDIGTVPAGQFVDVDIIVNVGAGLSGTITNVAELSANNDSDPSNNVVTETATIASLPDLVPTDVAYIPPPTSVITNDSFLSSLGISSDISQLPPGVPLAANITIANNGATSVTSPYLVNVTVSPYRIVVVGGTYIAGAETPIFASLVPGPSPLAPAESGFAVSPISIAPATCGLFMLNATADATTLILEDSEANNTIQDWFFVPSNQSLAINVNHIRYDVEHAEPWPVLVAEFDVFYAGPAPGNVTIGQSKVIWGTGHDNDFVAVVPPRGAAIASFDLFVDDLVEHKVSSFLNPGTAEGKLTAISPDGCVIRQASHTTNIYHEE